MTQGHTWDKFLYWQQNGFHENRSVHEGNCCKDMMLHPLYTYVPVAIMVVSLVVTADEAFVANSD